MKTNHNIGTSRLCLAITLLLFTGRIAPANAQTNIPSSDPTPMAAQQAYATPVQSTDGAVLKLADLLDPNLCTNSISPTAAAYGSAGGNGAVTVTTGSACTWTAASNAPWITITQGSTGMGTETIAYTVTANTTTNTRTATITIAAQTVTVTETSGPALTTLQHYDAVSRAPAPTLFLCLASSLQPPPL